MKVESSTNKTNTSLLVKLGLVVVGMFGFGYAMVPLYNVFCDIAGLNGRNSNLVTQSVEDYTVDESRTVRVEFVTSLNQGLNWEFRPDIYSMQVHPGKLYTTHFLTVNKTSNDMVGQAIPSIAPSEAASYFHKTECFCFTNQTLAAGESREMPVVFVVDPKLPPTVDTVSLSYTFFDISKDVSKQSGYEGTTVRSQLVAAGGD